MTKTRTSRAKRDRPARFVLGHEAFGKVSLVEGIVPSPALRADLRRLSDAPHQQRRDVLSRRYGKK
jgi:hypothetical protein